MASAGVKQTMENALKRLAAAGVEVRTRQNDPKVAAVETAIAPARQRSMAINAWECRWPLNTYRTRDGSKLSSAALDRLQQAEAMTLDDYRRDLADRDKRRTVYHALATEFDACITLSAPGAAPVGLGWTGDPVFVVPGSMLGVPALSLPVLHDGGLPLGLQLLGFADSDAELFATAAAVLAVVK
jgi:Asp-tRNA(Asn)/Glu-tRNA(Gln) amidotransferase A subunit family amidase